MSGFTLRETLAKNSASASWRADDTALTFETRSLTYGELVTEVDNVAEGLRQEGFRHGDRVMALLPNGVEYVELFFAVASLGGVLVPANYLLSAREVEHVWNDSGSTWLVLHERFAQKAETVLASLSDLDRVFTVGATSGLRPYEELRRDGSGFVPLDVDITDLALLQYTSGTSGLPKAAMHTHSSLMWNMMQQVVDFGLTKDDTYVCVPALCWAAGFHDFFLPLLWVGGHVVLLPSQNFDPEELARLTAEHRGTIVLLVPSVLRKVAATGVFARYDLSHLRLLLSGGEPLPIELIGQVQAALPKVWLAQVYGMTEGPMIMTFLSEADAHSRRGSAGKALCTTQLRIVDELDNPVAAGVVGEIVVRSPGTMVGYLNAGAKNDEVFRTGWFHTGDGGYLDSDGFLYIAGRVKDMFITGGLNVYPAEIERVLLSHDDVAEAAVVGVPDEQLGEVGKAYVVLRDPSDTTLDWLRAFAADQLATYKLPRWWETYGEPLPRTASGKIKKSALPKETSRITTRKGPG